MIRFISFLFLVSLTSCCTVDEPPKNRIAELNEYWAEVSRCVNEGDFYGYEATTHPEGVLVAGTSEKAYPLAKALSRWKQEFDDTKSGKIKAGVSFRFSKRLGDETTAHETGMFLYYQIKADGKKKAEYIHFEALLLKKADGWKIIMEYQKSKGTKADWDKLEETSI